MKHKGMSYGKGKSTLQKDKDGHQVPGFLKGESAPMVKARTYTDWDSRVGASEKGVKITLPS